VIDPAGLPATVMGRRLWVGPEKRRRFIRVWTPGRSRSFGDRCDNFPIPSRKNGRVALERDVVRAFLPRRSGTGGQGSAAIGRRSAGGGMKETCPGSRRTMISSGQPPRYQFARHLGCGPSAQPALGTLDPQLASTNSSKWKFCPPSTADLIKALRPRRGPQPASSCPGTAERGVVGVRPTQTRRREEKKQQPPLAAHAWPVASRHG